MQRISNQRGFTLTELIISMSILTIVSLLGYIVLSQSTEAMRVADAQAQLQSNLRNVMQALVSELRCAYSERNISPKNAGEMANVALPVGTIALTVSTDGRQVTFQKPVATAGKPVPAPSPQIVIRLRSEDVGFANGNGKIDTGEDANNNKLLDRFMERTQGTTVTKLGSVNDISDIVFQLRASEDSSDLNKGTLLVRLMASKAVGAKKRLVKADLEARINLEN